MIFFSFRGIDKEMTKLKKKKKKIQFDGKFGNKNSRSTEPTASFVH